MVEWECFCYNTKAECKHNLNGTALVNVQILMEDKKCRSTNLECHNRKLRSWKQWNDRYLNEFLMFSPLEYCNEDDWFAFNDCSVENDEDNTGHIGCYVVNSPGSYSSAIPQANIFAWIAIWTVYFLLQVKFDRVSFSYFNRF